jgi:chlorite dismutase
MGFYGMGVSCFRKSTSHRLVPKLEFSVRWLLVTKPMSRTQIPYLFKKEDRKEMIDEYMYYNGIICTIFISSSVFFQVSELKLMATL